MTTAAWVFGAVFVVLKGKSGEGRQVSCRSGCRGTTDWEGCAANVALNACCLNDCRAIDLLLVVRLLLVSIT